ncbi:hypothetical protein [Phaeocystidibacter marisrubri]|uniref:hypothetical protein n=1 Tax=Phaeocystidibacter marisrubri TaxID=1577780 RepID=UPI001478A57F|nr:hypothetical protein [Phaeocystidibacter marisrubri]GGH67435.1 hypothetical protein GCM10011318_06400 [Phaeocystidibacter marisrubri]
MRTTAPNILEKLGMRKANVEGPLCLWRPENNRLISGYKKVKSMVRKSESE